MATPIRGPAALQIRQTGDSGSGSHSSVGLPIRPSSVEQGHVSGRSNGSCQSLAFPGRLCAPGLILASEEAEGSQLADRLYKRAGTKRDSKVVSRIVELFVSDRWSRQANPSFSNRNAVGDSSAITRDALSELKPARMNIAATNTFRNPCMMAEALSGS